RQYVRVRAFGRVADGRQETGRWFGHFGKVCDFRRCLRRPRYGRRLRRNHCSVDLRRNKKRAPERRPHPGETYEFSVAWCCVPAERETCGAPRAARVELKPWAADSTMRTAAT